jgi:hypothetical protein
VGSGHAKTLCMCFWVFRLPKVGCSGELSQ